MNPDQAHPFRWGVIGPGNIARRFAGAFKGVPGAQLHSIYGRSPERAKVFAAEFGGRIDTDLAAFLADPQLDGVYIATPHAQHGEYVRAALEAGKPVLCEKPLVPTLAEAEQLIALARTRGVFLMEALWTRFLPAYDVMAGWLREGRLGTLRGMLSNFSFPNDMSDLGSRMWNPDLAGGSLLDIGIYNLAVTRWVLEQAYGECPALEHLQAEGRLAPTGVDASVSVTMRFKGGFVSQFRCGFDAVSACSAEIFGSSAAIRMPDWFHMAERVELLRRNVEPERVHAPHHVNGFEGEIAEAQACIRAGLLESPRMPHRESLALLECMDEIRRQIGVRYPFE
ncbi:Gfo/Idh/MocA family protein [Roseateles paludis]|jgi:predicted dehydrogenase|uniref:Gfo/Idh/MocA family oxidoreductase n=1 Tax=Roseateles paludis TaxID=3145238 RepID=A0ABV0FZ58_9BURK